jgi:hypothetical protein
MVYPNPALVNWQSCTTLVIDWWIKTKAELARFSLERGSYEIC